MIVREVDNILKQNEFERIENKRTKELDLIYYKKKSINVFLGNQNYSTIGFREINNLSYHLREILIEEDINVYNSYLIYCIEKAEIKEEDIILLERSSKYLRKYIIRQVEDIDRIFFLNKISNDIDLGINTFPQINEDIKEIVNKMINDEKISKLSTKEIESIVDNILESLGENNEN